MNFVYLIKELLIPFAIALLVFFVSFQYFCWLYFPFRWLYFPFPALLFPRHPVASCWNHKLEVSFFNTKSTFLRTLRLLRPIQLVVTQVVIDLKKLPADYLRSFFWTGRKRPNGENPKQLSNFDSSPFCFRSLETESEPSFLSGEKSSNKARW